MFFYGIMQLILNEEAFMKKIVIAFIITITASLSATTVYASLFEQRSVVSKIIEMSFRVGQLNRVVITEDIAEAYFATQKVINQRPHHLPRLVYRTTVTQHHSQDDMPYYQFTPSTEDKTRVIVYFHGGSYVTTASIIHFQFIDRLSHASGYTVLLPIYPLAPEYTHQDAFEKLTLWYADLVEANPNQSFVFIGDSAGGGLALGFTQMLNLCAKQLPETTVLISPWLDISLSNPDVKQVQKLDPLLNASAASFLGDAWRGDTDPLFYQVSPLYGEFEGLPPIHVFTGTYDILYPDVLLLKSQEHTATIDYYIYDKMTHVFPLYPLMKEANEAFDIILEIIKNP